MSTRSLPTLLALIGLAACSSAKSPDAADAASAGQQPPTRIPVTWTASAALPDGKRGVVTLDATIEDGWHVYSVAQPAAQPAGGPIPTRITIVSGQNVTAAGGPKAETPPQISFDSAFKMNVAEHDRQARFTVPIALATAPAPDSVRVDVRYQTCNASLCLPPRTVHLAAAMTRGS